MNDVKCAPNIRFPGFNSDWKKCKLSDVLEVVTKRNGKKYTKSDVLSVSDEYGCVNQIRFQGRSFAGDDISNYKIVQTGDIVYTRSPLQAKPFGIIKLVTNETGIVSPLYIVNQTLKDNSPEFIYYLFDSPIKTNNYLSPLVRKGAKNTMNISEEEWLSGEIYITTSYEEQQKIADFLSSFDEVIAASEQEVANLETQKKAVMKKIFSQEVRFKRKDGTDFPEWTSIQLGECFSFKNGVNASRDAFRSDGIKCIGVSDVYKCMPLLSQNIKGTVSLSAAEITRYAVEYGDILFQRSSETFEDIGHASVYVDNDKAVFNGFVICAKPNKLFYNPHFLHYIMQSDDIRSQTIRLGAGAQHYNIGQDSLSSLIVLFPSLDEQQLIADFLSDLDEAIAAAKKELDLWKELKKGLLQQMFV